MKINSLAFLLLSLCVLDRASATITMDGPDATIMKSDSGYDLSVTGEIDSTYTADLLCCGSAPEYTSYPPEHDEFDAWAFAWEGDVTDNGDGTATLLADTVGTKTATVHVTTHWTCVDTSNELDVTFDPPTNTYNVVAVEIEINNTSTTDDDGVILQSVPVSQVDLSVPCRARIVGTSAATAVTLNSAGHKIKFGSSSSSVADSYDVTLPADSGWASFVISGVTASSAMNDESITAALGTAAASTSDAVSVASVTVYSFGNPTLIVSNSFPYELITLHDGTGYKLSGDFYQNHHAVLISSSAEIMPSGADRTKAPLTYYYIGPAQNANFTSGILELTYDTPSITYSYSSVTGLVVPQKIVDTKSLSGPYLDSQTDNRPFIYPLGQFPYARVLPRSSSSGTELAIVGDSPGLEIKIAKDDLKPNPSGSGNVNVQYHPAGIRAKIFFKTWTIAHDIVNNKTIPLLQKTWSVDVSWTSSGGVSGGTDVSASVSALSSPDPVFVAPTADTQSSGPWTSTNSSATTTLSYP